MRLGIDSYSLRWQGWDAFQLLEYAAQIGLDNVHFSSRHDLASLDEGYLLSLKRRADELGLTIELGMGSFDRYSSSFQPRDGSGEQQLADMLRAAAVVGSPVVRCFLGSDAERRGPVPIKEHIQEGIRTLRAVAPLARELRVKVAVENHGGVDLLARELAYLVEEAGPDAVGVCLDTGNPTYAGEDPLLTTEVLAPHVVTSHVRDSRVWLTSEGAMAQWVPLGQGDVDLLRLFAIWREKCPQAPCNLETITGHEPHAIPFRDPDSPFWQMFPDMLARDFVRFLALAERGQARPLEQLLLPSRTGWPGSDEQGRKLVEQQRLHFEESVFYAREVLGLGERGR